MAVVKNRPKQYLSPKENSKLDEVLWDSKSVKKWKRVDMPSLLNRTMMNNMM